jgi:branched-chain amino acid aminotransferase
MTERTPVPGLVNINGVITPIAEGRISVLDHGFLFGDNIYETMRTYNRSRFCLPVTLSGFKSPRAPCFWLSR